MQSRFAFYLIPPFDVSQTITSWHDVLKKQFGLKAGARFQVHMTIKGFFKKKGGSITPIVGGLDRFLSIQTPFPVAYDGYRVDDIGFGFDYSRLNSQLNQPLQNFREEIVEIIRPFIADDCDFIERDLSGPFKPHITLAFRDVSPLMYDGILAYLEDAPKPRNPFTARDFTFLEFYSDDWEGAWWETLSWCLIKAWHI